MEQYIVTGMSCAACSARVEKAVSKVPGVTSCSVSLNRRSLRQSQMPDTEHRKKEKERQRHSRHQYLPEKIC